MINKIKQILEQRNEYLKPEEYATVEIQSSKQPYKCPICLGSGIVSGGFYNQTSGYWSSSDATEKCISCDGKGIIWG